MQAPNDKNTPSILIFEFLDVSNSRKLLLKLTQSVTEQLRLLLAGRWLSHEPAGRNIIFEAASR